MGFDSEYFDSEYSGSGYNDNDSEYSASNVEFTGACKKKLHDVIIVWSVNKHFVAEQFTEFSRRLNIMTEKISIHMGKLIEQQEKIGFMAFRPEPRDPLEWADADGNIDPDGKKFADDIVKLEMKQVSASLRKYKTDWTTIFPWIYGQMCPKTQQRLMRSKNCRG